MFINRRYLFLLAVLMSAVMVFVSCGGPLGGARSAEIVSIGWILENIDRNFWTSSDSSTPTAFINFSGTMADTKLTASDFLEVRATAPDGTYWSYDTDDIVNSGAFNSSTGRFSNLRCWDDGDEIPIGTYTFLVILTNGSTDTYTMTIPEPGSTTTGGNTVAYTEDSSYVSSTPAYSTSLLHRAVISSATNNGTTVTLQWSVDDERVNTGNLWFYSSSNDYIGMLDELMIDPVSGDISSACNNGMNFHTDGNTNTVTLTSSLIEFESGNNISDIAKVVIPLYDGSQYPTETWYDSRSYSALVSVTTP